MRFVVVGAGAIGGLVGARLAGAEHAVTLVARGAHHDAIRERGLTIEAATETGAGTVTSRIPVVARVIDISIAPDTIVLVAVKTQDAATVLRELAVVAPPATPIVCLTNGLEAERLAARWFSNVYGCCVWSPATHLEPGIVQAWGTPVAGVFDVGSYPAGDASLAHAIAGAFAGAGLDACSSPDIMRWKRGKLLSNLSNAVDALCGPPGRAHPVVATLRAEGERCFVAADLPYASDDELAERRGPLAVGTIAGRHKSGGSTWQSLRRGATTVECEYLNGEITLLGRLHAIATPMNDAVLRTITRAVAAGVPAGSLTLEDLSAQLGGQAT
ncbi:MAG: ketopantoate reductase family protein [Deltaproteobacteria bacterium]|nr:ketopantoate reductase family protein [Deltaproteobacteria bacterium]